MWRKCVIGNSPVLSLRLAWMTVDGSSSVACEWAQPANVAVMSTSVAPIFVTRMRSSRVKSESTAGAARLGWMPPDYSGNVSSTLGDCSAFTLLRRCLFWARYKPARDASTLNHVPGVNFEQVALGHERLGRSRETPHVLGGTSVPFLQRQPPITGHHPLKTRSCERVGESRHVTAVGVQRCVPPSPGLHGHGDNRKPDAPF